MQAVRRQLPPPAGPCQASPSERSQQPSPWPSSHPTHAPSTTPSSTTPSKCIAPEQYVAADEIFKARLAALKREEEWLHREQERLEAEKAQHVRQACEFPQPNDTSNAAQV
ncbi:MAG: serine threonine- kinase TOUSLED-like [Trebouxia sp. A1-2]|nr:MAG: serine threonine- kinase TOUSLED-like [Trebouxia sp. A1-2]